MNIVLLIIRMQLRIIMHIVVTDMLQIELTVAGNYDNYSVAVTSVNPCAIGLYAHLISHETLMNAQRIG